MMASQATKPRPENGMTLLVIHDFTARSADELSLTRGDRVELIERDDDFGDGWYLGRHEATGATGLFPEVYTKIAPVQTLAPALQQQFQKSTPVIQQHQQFAQPQVAQMTPQQQAIETERLHELHKQEQQHHMLQKQALSPAPIDTRVKSNAPNVNAPVSPVSPVRAESPILQAQDHRVSLPTPTSPNGPEQLERHVSASQVLDSSSPQEPAPLQTHSQEQRADMPQTTRPLSSNGVTMTASAPPTTIPASAIPKNIATDLKHGHGADSPVMNEALAVIQEHISDMSTPRNSQQVDRRPVTNDSGSEYSMEHPGMDPRRMSYINGSETDEEEEEERRLNRAEVNSWNEKQVSEYLASVGVEEKHCAVFREQEITGDVLLAMDQPTVFLKEFDLGSVGRRLKTWQKIKALQDEVASLPSMVTNARRQTSNFSSQYGSDAGGDRGFGGMSPSSPQRVMSSSGRPESRSTVNRYSQRQRHMDSINSMGSIDSQTTAYGEPTQQTRPSTGAHRPSAASIRELNHSRRHSSIDSPILVSSKPQTPILPQNTAGAPQAHKKLPSFDRNWTMGSQPSSARESGVRPVSQAGAIPEQTEEGDLNDLNKPTPFDYDRGYFSGTEVEGGSNRQSRNVLKKRISTHSRNSSYTEEARQRSATTVGNRTSRFGSMDSLHQSHVSPAGAKYYGLAGSRRTPSINKRMSGSPQPPPKDPHLSQPSPTVTKLEDRGQRSPTVENSEWLKPSIDGRQAGGFRAISDAVTGTERKMLTDKLQSQHSMDVASPTHSSTCSPSRTGSSTPSGGPSMDLGDDGSKTSMSSATPKAARKKSKKETSAYKNGLLKISPKEAMKDCDYSGWMKKKSTNLMTTWKPRLFILKGRRLSYYYSENDTEEKGLIDISFHRVLPADQDRLTGLHAQLTGAAGSAHPNSTTVTTAQQDVAAAAAKDGGLGASPDNNMFIFKLVPPRAGLSRAVTFTKPTVHYFAVENVAVARLWMAALMKATIEREGDGKVTTTYQQKTISLRRAREMRQRPPALRDDDDVLAGQMGGDGTAGTGGSVGLGLSIEDREGEEKEVERMKEEQRGYRGVETHA